MALMVDLFGALERGGHRFVLRLAFGMRCCWWADITRGWNRFGNGGAARLSLPGFCVCGSILVTR